MAGDLGIDDRVIFYGGLPRSQVFNLLEDIDLYVQPSLTEGLPRALIEAMGHGCPAVASRVGGIPELIEDEFLFDPKSPRELADIIGFLISDPTVLCEQSDRNFQKAQRYHREVVSRSRRKFYAAHLENLMPALEANC
jgi:glycosyltransferase involved in cell wall biosynthesis